MAQPDAIFQHKSNGEQVEVEDRIDPENSAEGDEMVKFGFVKIDEGSSLPVGEFYHRFEKVADSREEL